MNCAKMAEPVNLLFGLCGSNAAYCQNKLLWPTCLHSVMEWWGAGLLSVWSKVQMIAYGPTDASATPPCRA